MNAMIKTFARIFVFAAAMALLESAVVIYLRALMYPEGFGFPLKMLNQGLAVVELSREAATIVMLVMIGVFIGGNRNQKLAYFLFGFAVWDIFYYVFLKIFLNWPESLLTWDVLFLIPMMWVGPVWAPILLSFTMMVLAWFLARINAKGLVPLGGNIWLMIMGSVVVIASFCYEPYLFISGETELQWYDVSSFFEAGYQPEHFPLAIFFTGYAVIIAGIWRYVRSNSFSKGQLLDSQFI